jgi:hypothetical protein
VFAYDLNEPDVLDRLLKLAKRGSVRIILDNAALHTSTATKKAPEDEFQKMFDAAAKAPAEMLRGKFARYSHDKVFIVYKGKSAIMLGLGRQEGDGRGRQHAEIGHERALGRQSGRECGLQHRS